MPFTASKQPTACCAQSAEKNNPDVVVDLDDGEVYVKMPDGGHSEESIGNIEQELEE
jgi:hypothetical protein